MSVPRRQHTEPLGHGNKRPGAAALPRHRPPEELLAALGLEMSDLFAPSSGTEAFGFSDIQAGYDYTGEDGRLSYQVAPYFAPELSPGNRTARARETGRSENKMLGRQASLGSGSRSGRDLLPCSRQEGCARPFLSWLGSQHLPATPPKLDKDTAFLARSREVVVVANGDERSSFRARNFPARPVKPDVSFSTHPASTPAGGHKAPLCRQIGRTAQHRTWGLRSTLIARASSLLRPSAPQCTAPGTLVFGVLPFPPLPVGPWHDWLSLASGMGPPHCQQHGTTSRAHKPAKEDRD